MVRVEIRPLFAPFHAGFHQPVDMRVPHISDERQEKTRGKKKWGKKSGKVCLWQQALDITVAQPNSCPTQHSSFSQTPQLTQIIGAGQTYLFLNLFYTQMIIS